VVYSVSDRRVRVPKTAELIAASIRREIVLGTLNEGDPLPPESQLMEEFGVSRPTLREAYRILESEGLISVQRGAHGGGRVHSPSAQAAARYAGLVLHFQGTSLAEIYEARTTLEAPCAALVAARRTEAGLRALRQANADAEAALDDPTAILARHHRFHALLVELAGNSAVTFLASMIDSILDQADIRHVEAQAGAEDERKASRRAQRTHARMVELIEAKDAKGAEELWRTHLDAAAKRVLKDLGSATVLDIMS